MTTDRNALIDAAAKAVHDTDAVRSGEDPRCWEHGGERHRQCWRDKATPYIDAVLPLIADAIETLTKFPPSGPFGEALGIERAARLVRSLARPGTGE